MNDKKPTAPYSKYAFANPYNLAILGGFASAALLTGNWWLGLVGGGVEAIWMLFAPDSKLLRKLWFDKRFADEQEAARARALADRFHSLPHSDALRCTSLMDKHAQIDALAKGNPAFTADLLKNELGKLDNLVDSFIELSVSAARYQDYLETISIGQIEADERRYREQVDRARDPEQRALAQKNLAVVTARREKYAEIRRYMSRALGELELIENTFRLLADQIVTMQSPQELGGQLDELIDGVEAVKQTTHETDKLLQAVER
jgi:hypothetical protein